MCCNLHKLHLHTQTGQSAVQSEMAFKKVNTRMLLLGCKSSCLHKTCWEHRTVAFYFSIYCTGTEDLNSRDANQILVSPFSSTPPLACHPAPLLPPILSQLAVEKEAKNDLHIFKEWENVIKDKSTHVFNGKKYYLLSQHVMVWLKSHTDYWLSNLNPPWEWLC